MGLKRGEGGGVCLLEGHTGLGVVRIHQSGKQTV